MKNKLITALDETSEPYIHHFQIWTGKKFRHVAEPFEPLKSALAEDNDCLLYTSPSPRDVEESRMPSSA